MAAMLHHSLARRRHSECPLSVHRAAKVKMVTEAAHRHMAREAMVMALLAEEVCQDKVSRREGMEGMVRKEVVGMGMAGITLA